MNGCQILCGVFLAQNFSKMESSDFLLRNFTSFHVLSFRRIVFMIPNLSILRIRLMI